VTTTHLPLNDLRLTGLPLPSVAMSRRLLRIADRIDDPAYQQSFLEGVPENARTLALAQVWLPP
jgi:hypothetical protein